MHIRTINKRFADITSLLKQPRLLGKQITYIVSLIVIVLSVMLFVHLQPTHAVETELATHNNLASLIQAIPAQASAQVVYQARDSQGHTMDTAKIIADPRYPKGGGYLAVYHSQRRGHHYIDPGQHYYVFVAFSRNLRDWRDATELGSDASQPSIATTSRGGYLVVWEQTDFNGHGNHFRLRYYASTADLFTAHWSRQYDSPIPNRENFNKGITLSACAEGTPNIYAMTFHPDIDHATIMLGGHYNANCATDRQMTGVLTFAGGWRAAQTHWQESRDTGIDNAILHWLIRTYPDPHVGNIGDRDMVVVNGYRFGLFEGQYRKDDFSSFRCFLYDYQTGQADPLTIVTSNGGQAFGNPTISKLIAPNGKPALVITLYAFSQNSGAHENGELIYFHDIAS